MENNSLEKDREWLNGDAVTMIIAGRYDIRSELGAVFINPVNQPADLSQ